MSTIRVDNFGPSAGGTTYSARGIAKAWVNFNGTGTIAARDSLNLSSLTDNGTGNYDIIVASSFSDTNYIITGQSTKDAGETYFRSVGYVSGGTKTASTVQIEVEDNTSSTNRDNEQIYIAHFGDLA
jgi:hypothetical protein